mgnify:CR=1 FL=1
MTIRIVTDSTCDLPREIVEENGIKVVRLYIHINDKNYLDEIDLTRHEYYERLPSIHPPATTAIPSTDVFKKAYDSLAEEGATEILSIHISHKLSGMVNVAEAAARETTSAKVTVLDSRQLSMATGFEALEAAKAAREGKSVKEILARLNELIPHLHVFAALDTLEYLRRGGRMNFAFSAIGTLLKVKPILKMFDGEPASEKVRTRQKALNRLKELLEKYSPYDKLAILHSNAEAAAREVLDEVKHLVPAGDVLMGELNPILGTHLGPGVIGFCCISKNPGG